MLFWRIGQRADGKGDEEDTPGTCRQADSLRDTGGFSQGDRITHRIPITKTLGDPR